MIFKVTMRHLKSDPNNGIHLLGNVKHTTNFSNFSHNFMPKQSLFESSFISCDLWVIGWYTSIPSPLLPGPVWTELSFCHVRSRAGCRSGEWIQFDCLCFPHCLEVEIGNKWIASLLEKAKASPLVMTQLRGRYRSLQKDGHGTDAPGSVSTKSGRG